MDETGVGLTDGARRVKRSKEGGLSGMEERATSPRGTKVLNVRAGEKINACSLMSQFNDTSRARWWRPFK